MIGIDTMRNIRGTQSGFVYGGILVIAIEELWRKQFAGRVRANRPPIHNLSYTTSRR